MRITLVAVALLLARDAAAGPSCLSYAQASTAESRTAAANEKSFAKALASAKLAPIELETVEWPTGPDDAVQRVIHKTLDGKELDVLVIGSTDTDCGGPPAEVVKKGKTLYLVEREPTTKTTTRKTACDCDLRPAGGCTATRELHTIALVVPKGMKFGGTKTVSYSVEELQIAYGIAQMLPCKLR